MADEDWQFAAVGVIVVSLLMSKYVFGLGVKTDPVDWTVAFGTSPVMSPSMLLIWRMLLGAFFAVMFVIYVYDTWGDYSWLYFLTHWTLTFEVLYCILAAPCTWLAVQARKEQESTAKPGDEARTACIPAGFGTEAPPSSPKRSKQPAVVSLTMPIFQVSLPMSFLVVVLYWTLDKPLHKLCPFGDYAKGEFCEEVPGFLNFFVHLFDFFFLFVDFFVGYVPYNWDNSGWLLVYASAYIAWTLVHYWSDLGPPIYAVLDWSNPHSTLQLVAGLAFVVFPFVNVLFWGLGKLRDRCFGGGK